MTGRRIAVIGGGVGGITAGYVLSRTDHLTLFEADGRLGGHLVDPGLVIDTMDYAHPAYTPATAAAQRRLPGLNTGSRCWPASAPVTTSVTRGPASGPTSTGSWPPGASTWAAAG